jgi:DNA-binding beta-propeller fold protein YncE
MSALKPRLARSVRFLSALVLICLLVSMLPAAAPQASAAATHSQSAIPPNDIYDTLNHALLLDESGSSLPAPQQDTPQSPQSIPVSDLLGTLQFAAEVDADNDHATNPTSNQPVPVIRIGTPHTLADAPDPVLYATIGLAVQVVPDNPQRNPAGTIVTFRIWNEEADIDITRSVRADAWGAALTEVLLNDLHLRGRFSYQASAPDFGETPVRQFAFDTTRYSSDTQLGAARIASQIEADGRLVVDIESDVAIAEQLGAVQLTALRVIPVTDEPGEPELEALPPLVGKRTDAYHARAEIYLDPGYYTLQAELAAQDGIVDAKSAPLLVHVAESTPPPIDYIDSVLKLNEEQSTALVHYRSPDGNAAIGYRTADELAAALEQEPAAETFSFFRETSRVGAFSFQTTSYSLTTYIHTDDGKKKVSLDGFHYDPLSRRYDIFIESLMAEPVEDKLTVEVLGPNGVVIYEETVPVLLDPVEPLQYAVTVPTDRGEPYGIRLTLHDPISFDWLFEKTSQMISSSFRYLKNGIKSYGDIESGAEIFVKILEINMLSASVECSFQTGCSTAIAGLTVDLVSGEKPWYEIVLISISDAMRGKFGLQTGDSPTVVLEKAVKKLKDEGFAVGSAGLDGKIDLGITVATYQKQSQKKDKRRDACVGSNPPPPDTKNDTSDADKRAKEYNAQLGTQLTNIAARINERYDALDKNSKEGMGVELPIPYPGLAEFLIGKFNPKLAFKIEGGAKGDYSLHASFRLQIGYDVSLMLKNTSWLDKIKSAGKMFNLITFLYHGIETSRLTYEMISLMTSAAVTPTSSSFPPGKDGGGDSGGSNCPPPPPPNGNPDDRRDAFQNQHDPRPDGISGRIMTLQQQLLVAQQAGLQRAAAYYRVQLRQAELEAFQADTTNALSMTNQMETLLQDTEQRMQGLLNGTIQPAAGQTITDALVLEYTSFVEGLSNTSIDQQRRDLLDSLQFAERQYQALRGQELALQRELRQMAQVTGVGVLDSGLVTWALGAMGSMGIRAIPVQIVPGVSSGMVGDSRYYDPYEAPPVLIVPTGGFARLRTSQQAHEWLETYVTSGGTLLVLTQYENSDWEMLPGGEVRGIGYEQDILCKTASVRIVNPSRWITGIAHDLPDIQVDGSLTAWPDNATVVLMRTSGSKKPAMIEYPYGNGHVVATSAYPDFSGVNGMQSRDDVIFARSLFALAYLAGTGEPVKQRASPGEQIRFSLVITNTTATSITQITAWGNYYERGLGESWRWAAHRNTDVHSSQVIDLDPPLASGASRLVTLAFAAPAQSGLFRSGYALSSISYSGVIPGPFYQVRSEAVPLDLLAFSLQSDQTAYPFGARAVLTATLVNDQDTPRTFELVPVVGLETGSSTVTVAAHATEDVVLQSTRIYDQQEVQLEVRENGRLLSVLQTTLIARISALDLAATSTAVVAGLPTSVDVTIRAQTMPASSTLIVQLFQNDTLRETTQATLADQGAYVAATTSLTLPAADIGDHYVVRVALPDESEVSGLVLPVRRPVRISGAVVQTALTAGTTTPDAVQVHLAATPFASSAKLRVLVQRNGTTVASGPEVAVATANQQQQVLLDVTLPGSLDLDAQYSLLVTGTALPAGENAREVQLQPFTLGMDFAPPTVQLASTDLQQGAALTVVLAGITGLVLPAATAQAVLHVRGVSVPFGPQQHKVPIALQDDSVELVLTLPDDLLPGSYQVAVALPYLAGWQSKWLTWHIPPPVLQHEALPATATHGEVLNWQVTNVGGEDTVVNGSLELTDAQGNSLAEQTFAGLALPLDIAVTLPFTLPMLNSDRYVLTWQAQDHNGKLHAYGQTLEIDGIDALLQSQTHQVLYHPDDDRVEIVNNITTTEPLNGATLRLRIMKTDQQDTAVVTTLAGLAPGVYDGIGLASRFDYPGGTALSSDGTFALVADTNNNTIRRIEVASGEVTTLAGLAGEYGSSDGVGDAARFSVPEGITLSSDGTFALVADTGNDTIRRIEVATGEVTTLAGLADEPGSSDGVGDAARFRYPACIALSSDNTFALVADTGNDTIRRIEVASGEVTTLAGVAGSFGAGSSDGVGAAARFESPAGIALSSDGTFALVADTGNHTIRRIEVATGEVTTLAGQAGSFGAGSGDGVGDTARFRSPDSIALSNDGTFALVADTGNDTIRRIEVATAEVTTLAGLAGESGSSDGVGDAARFTNPEGIALSSDGSFALVADGGNDTIRRIEVASGEVSTLAGRPDDRRGDDGTGQAAAFSNPRDVALSSDNTFALVADTDNHTIRHIEVASGEVTTLAGLAGESGSSDGIGDAARFGSPQGIALSSDGTFALVADTGNSTIHRIEVASGEVTTLAGQAGVVGSNDGVGDAARFRYPEGIALSSDGTFALVADTGNYTIRRIEVASGEVTTLAGVAGEYGSSDGVGDAARFDYPYDVALSSDNTFALVADIHGIRRIEVASGTVTSLASLDVISSPSSIALSNDERFALVVDNHCIIYVDITTGEGTSLVGDWFSYGSSDGIGDAAQFNSPDGITLSSDGSFALVADTDNNTIRHIALGDSSPLLREEWLTLSGSGALSETLPLLNPNLLDNPNAYGLLFLDATLYSPRPTDVVTTARPIIASSRSPFAILDTNTMVAMAAEQSIYRTNVDGYAADDAASTVVLHGVVRNTTDATTDIILDVVKNDYTRILYRTFSGVPAGETRTFIAYDSSPMAGEVSYRAYIPWALDNEYRSMVTIVEPDVSVESSVTPASIDLGESVVAEVVVQNSGQVTGFVSIDWGDTTQDVSLEAGNVITLTEEFAPTDMGNVTIPLVFSGDVQRTDTHQVKVKDETLNAELELTGTTRDASTLVQSEDAALSLTLENTHAYDVETKVVYTLAGTQATSQTSVHVVEPGTMSLDSGLATLPVGAYQATFIAQHIVTGVELARVTLSFEVVAPHYELALHTSSGSDVTPYDVPENLVPFEIVSSSSIVSDLAWDGTLFLSGDVEDQKPLTLAPGDTDTYRGSFNLDEARGPQTIEVMLVDTDGTVREEQTLVVTTTPRLAFAVSLDAVSAADGVPGGSVKLDITLTNNGDAGEVLLTVMAFEQSEQYWITVPGGGQHQVTLNVPVPVGLLDGTFPLLVQMDDQEIRTDVNLAGAEIALHQSLDARTYDAFSQATWTVGVEGIEGGTTTYDLFLRYRGEEYTRTLQIGAGDLISTTWSLDVGPVSDRATVLLTNHPENESQPRYTIVVDSQFINVIEDPAVYLVSDKQSYESGEVVHLTLHLNEPVRLASVMVPENFPLVGDLLLWTSLQYTQTNVLTGTFEIPLTLPAVMATGRYFIRYSYDGQDRTLPIDVFGTMLDTEELRVLAAGGAGLTATAPTNARRQTVSLSAGMPIAVSAKLRLNKPVPNARLIIYAFAPDNTPIPLGEDAGMQQDLPAGVSTITLQGTLETTQPGPHQIVLRVHDADATVSLGGETTVVDVGAATISDLTTDKGVYTPGEQASGTLSMYGAGETEVSVTTSDGTALLDQTITLDGGFTELQFTPPTDSERDEVIIATINGSDGMQSSGQVAYKVADSFDTTAPAVQIVDPPSGSQITFRQTADHVITLSGIITEEGELATVLVNGEAATVQGASFTIPVTLEQGINSFQVIALDAAGNQGMGPLHTVTGEPAYGIMLATSQASYRVGDIVHITSQVTTTEELTATVLFPFSGSLIRPISDTVQVASGRIILDDGLEWEGVVPSDAPLTIEWQGRATEAVTQTTIFALVQGEQMGSQISNQVDVAITAGPGGVYLPVIMR